MHHHPARMMRERRQTSLASTPVTSPSATAIVDSQQPTSTSAVNSAVNLTVPTSTTALAVVVSVLCLVILLGVGICMFRRWKRNAKQNTVPSQIIDFSSEKTRNYDLDSKLDLHASAYGLEKPSAVFMPGASAADMNPGWVPQINRAADLQSQSSSSSKKSKSSMKKSLRSSRGWDKTFSKIAPSERSPPPAYMIANGGPDRVASYASQVPLPPSPPSQSTLPPTPPTPPAKKKINPFSREIPPAKPVPMDLPPQMPLPSPARSASFANHQSASLADMERVDEEQAMPRLMTVVNPFSPTLDDELPIQVGETVRILEEYQDGWALVQRIGRIDAPKGVVPRTCITDRERIIPTYTPGRRL
ncbi:hypothetical protein C8R44DRAFT_728101 [Mycena epipterygia]|nr:hypothetical protein C8R44DRAFT_728101 [Mycena epipterygia]